MPKMVAIELPPLVEPPEGPSEQLRIDPRKDTGDEGRGCARKDLQTGYRQRLQQERSLGHFPEKFCPM